jgi:type VI protein secretion system component VasK
LKAAQLPSAPAWRPVRLELDGKVIDTSQSALQMEFSWPGTGTAQAAGAAVSADGSQAPFGSYLGPWAVVRLFQYADPRERGDKDAKWSSARGAGATAVVQAVVPPGRVQIARFPGNNVDLFNPRFFEGLKCPGQAVIPE